MNNDDLEKEITKVVKGKICEPNGYKNAIQTALYTNEKKTNKAYLPKMIATICCSLILLSGIVYAGYSIIQNVFNNRKGFETAINNDYIMDGLETYQKSNGVSVKINNMIIDDHNIGISFNVKFDEKSKLNSENIESLRFEKMVILDEENRILFTTRVKTVLYDFIKNNSLNTNIENFNETYINTGISSETRNVQSNQLDLIYNVASNEQDYPKSKEIVIYAENIILNENITIKGIWQIKQKLEDKFYNREKIIYNYKSNDEKDIISIGVETYATGTNLKLKLKLREKTNEGLIENLDEIEEIAKNNNINDIGANEKNLHEAIISEIGNAYEIFKDVYIKNENGIIFGTTESFNENEKLNYSKDQESIIYDNILDMTIYDCTSKIILHFIYENEEYNIELLN